MFATPSNMPAAPPVAAAPKSKWAEHRTPDGKVYYHNAETNVTSWDKPDELKAGQERAPAAQPAATAPKSKWAEHRTAEGKIYYHNTETNVTAWEKPDELKTGQERALGAAQTSWKELTAASGRKYYYNEDTKTTTWEIPEEMKAAAAAADALMSGKASSSVSATPAAVASASPRAADAATAGAAASTAAVSAAPDAVSKEAEAAAAAAAEAAAAAKKVFFAMLDGAGVGEEASWEEAMKRIISKPEYKVLQTLAERKAAFLEWKHKKREDKEEEERRTLRQRKVAFLAMLQGEATLTSRTRYHKVVSLFESDARWMALEDDELEREELFEEYSLSLERKEATERRANRKEQIASFRKLLEQHGVSARSQWRRVSDSLRDEPEYRAPPEKIEERSPAADGRGWPWRPLLNAADGPADGRGGHG